MNFWLGVFLTLATADTLFYTIWRNDIFEWNADPDQEKKTQEKGSNKDGPFTKETVERLEKRKLLEMKRQIIKGEAKDDNPPCAWIFESYLHVFLGLVLGWILFGILLHKHGIFISQLKVDNFDWSDLILLVGGWIGINGRLPTIAHDVQNWFKK